MNIIRIRYLLLTSIALLVFSCSSNDNLTHIEYNPQPYNIEFPVYTQLIDNREVILPEMPIPADNPLTVDGVELGRHLFYDNVLSADNTMSCSTCHLPEGAFTDNLAVSNRWNCRHKKFNVTIKRRLF